MYRVLRGGSWAGCGEVSDLRVSELGAADRARPEYRVPVREELQPVLYLRATSTRDG